MTADSQGNRTGAPAPPAVKEEVSPWKMLSTLGTAGALAGLLIVFVFVGTEPAIKAHKAEVLRLAIQEVLKGPDSYDTLFVVEGRLEEEPPPAADVEALDQVYVGYASDGSQVGFAIAAGEPGFQDVIQLIFGYDAVNHSLLGMKVLESKETPGLGDNIEKNQDFVQQFDGVATPLEGVNPRRATGDEHEVDFITGATISSRAVVGIINHALERFGPLIDEYNGGGSR
jgi:electron transport complex protein RnfG